MGFLRFQRFDYSKEMMFIIIFLAIYHLAIGLDFTIQGGFLPGVVVLAAIFNYLEGNDHLLFNNLRKTLRAFKVS